MKSKTYEEFVDKFKPKLTTDDCYTPEIVYNAIKDWAVKEYGITDTARIIRPFYPNGDYQAEDYSGECVVIDNPPFSILSQIVKWYTERGIRFFLFAPSLTLFSTASGTANYLPCDAAITYENGATVSTSFVTNMGAYKINVCPELHEIVKRANEENLRATKAPQPPKYDYPHHVVNAARLGYIAVHGESLKIKAEDTFFIRAMDAQKADKKEIYGCGFILSEKAAAEKAAAEKAAAEKAAAEKLGAVLWSLSERERKIIEQLGR